MVSSSTPPEEFAFAPGQKATRRRTKDGVPDPAPAITPSATQVGAPPLVTPIAPVAAASAPAVVPPIPAPPKADIPPVVEDIDDLDEITPPAPRPVVRRSPRRAIVEPGDEPPVPRPVVGAPIPTETIPPPPPLAPPPPIPLPPESLLASEGSTFQEIPRPPPPKSGRFSRFNGFGQFSQRQRFYAGIVAAVIVLVIAAVFILKSLGSSDTPTTTPLATTGSVAQGQPALFKNAYKVGGTRSYSFTVKTTSTPKGLKNASAVKSTMRAKLVSHVVRAAEDGSGVIELSLADVSFEPANSVDIAGRVVRMSIAPNGRITSIAGLRRFFGPMVGSSGIETLPSAAIADAVIPQLLFPKFAAAAVAPGGTWTDSSVVPIPFSGEQLTLTSNGRLDGFATGPSSQVGRINDKAQIPLNLAFNFAQAVRAITASGGDAIPAIPSDLSNATMTIGGSIDAVTDAQVVPATGDVVQLAGTVNAETRVGLTGASSPGVEGTPTNFTVSTKIEISLAPINRASAAISSATPGTTEVPGAATQAPAAATATAVSPGPASLRPGTVVPD